MSSKDLNPQAGQGHALPKKETDLFRSVVKLYECKQYKKGLKAADTVLKKFPNHGETLCMKGLILNCTGKRDEAINMVKMGLMNDMRSHVCWHVYGLIYRSERNYNEAIKAYKQALRIDKENIQIMKDLALLQIQMRDLAGFATTQHQILELKPNLKVSWLAFALGKHMKGDRKGAIGIIDTFLSTLEEGSVDLQKNYETSELALYKNSIIAEGGNWQDAIDHLDECKNKGIIVDQLSCLKLSGYYQLQLGLFNSAKETFLKLLERGSTEDYSVHTGYMLSILNIDGEISRTMLKRKGARALSSMLVLTNEQQKIVKEAYQNVLIERFPKSIATKRIMLTLFDVDSEEWNTSVDAYIQAGLIRGVPSLGDDLSSLFIIPATTNKNEHDIAKDAVDVKSHVAYKSIAALIDKHIASLESKSAFPGDDDVQPPSTLLWTWYLRSVLYGLAGEYSNAIDMVDKGLDQTPTAVDFYELKGRHLKISGDINAAVACVNTGRELDKQDRYINNQTTKYLLQADNEEEALKTIALFARHESDPEQNIFDMQVTWYELELAACYARKGNIGKSLKKYLAVEKHFEDIHEDQFDFHSYCIRKVTLRAYVDVLRWEDSLWGQDTYAKAAEGVIRNYLHLHDNPMMSVDESEPDYSSMTAAERKKAKAIARKKKLKADKKAAESGKNEEKEDSKNKNGKKKAIDEDPDGRQLLSKPPLEEAKKYASTLVKNAPKCFATWLCQYDVCSRRGKAMLALQALFKAKSLEGSLDLIDSEVFKRIINFHLHVKLADGSHAAVEEVFASEKVNLLGPSSKTLIGFVSEWHEKVKVIPLCSLPLRVEVAKAMIKCNVGTHSDASDLIVSRGLDSRGVTLQSCLDAINTLKSINGAGKQVQEFKTLAKNMYSLSSKF